MQGLAFISVDDRRRPVSVLALGPKTARLQLYGFRDVGAVFDDALADFPRLRALPALGQRSLAQLRERIVALLTSADEAGRVDWSAWERMCGLSADGDRPQPAFSERDRAVGIECLHLGVRAQRIRASGLTTLGCLADDYAAGFVRLTRAPRLGEGAAALVRRRLRSLAVFRDGRGDVDWEAFGALCRGETDPAAPQIPDGTGEAGVLKTPLASAVEASGDVTGPSGRAGAANGREPTTVRSVAERLAADQRGLPITCLALGRKTDRLAAEGLATLGDVADDAKAGWSRLSRIGGVGRSAIQLVEERLGIALSCADPQGVVDWRAFRLLSGLQAPQVEPAPLPDASRQRLVRRLHLGARAPRLAEAGILTVGELLEDEARGFERVDAAPWLGRQAVDLMQRRLRMLRLCRTDDGEVDWDLFDTLCTGRVVTPPALPEGQPAPPPQPLRPFSGAARSRPVETLRLGPKAKYLRQAGLRTVGCLLRPDVQMGLSRLPGVGRTTADVVRTRLADLAASLDENGDPDWDGVAASWGFPVVPDWPLETGLAFVEAIPETIRRWTEAHEEEADRLILSLRLGRERQARATLEEVGQRIGVTRERIRQRQTKLLNGLGAALLDDDQSLSPLQFSMDFRRWWRTAAEVLSTSTTLVWPAFVSALERAWGVPAARLADILPYALAVLTDEGQVVAPRHPLPPRLLEPLPPSLLRRPLRSFPVGRACQDLEAANITSFGGLLLAAMENRLPQGRSGKAAARLLAGIATSLSPIGEPDPVRLAAALGLPLLPEEPTPDPVAFLAAFNPSVQVAMHHGQMPGRAPDIWALRTSRLAEDRPTLDQTATVLGTRGACIKREETMLLSLLNAQLVSGDQSRAGVIWRPDFLAWAKQASAEMRASGRNFETFARCLSARWEMDASRLRKMTPGLWAALSCYPAGRRPTIETPNIERPRRDNINSALQEPGLIILRGFRRVH
ncbi:MAG: hypothetical protein K2X61_10685 [Caulobacteraceae bacterium]|nr:hypothetical protein [Caulobacteraceae bacterium]